MENSIMPPNLSGAYVSCYVKEDNYVEATKKALKQLNADGLYPEEVLQPIHEMESNSWNVHVKEQWADYIKNLPTQVEFNQLIARGEVVYSPLGSYKK